jgi:hypothetical protein
VSGTFSTLAMTSHAHGCPTPALSGGALACCPS